MNASSTYERFARYYDLYVQGFVADLPLYLSHCDNTNRVLEVGCGSGRVLKALLDAGRHVTGVDISSEMLALAEAKLRDYLSSGELTLINHNLVDAPLQHRFDCAFVTFYTFNYVLEDDAQQSFLHNLKLSMAEGGVLIADLFYPKAMAPMDQAGVWRESTLSASIQNIRVRDRREMVGCVERREQVYTNEEREETIVTLRRFVSKQEMNALLQNAGFGNIRFADGYEASGLQALEPDEATVSGYIVITEKGP